MKKLKKSLIKLILNPRIASTNKGNYGHALIIAGSKGRMGSAIIAARASLRTGCGLLTLNVPSDERNISQATIPEAMLIMRENAEYDLNSFSAVGIGPGIGTEKDSEQILIKILTKCNKPLVLDADALNIIALNKNLLAKIPKGTIITPHPIEFDRLFGTHKNTKERMDIAAKKAKEYNIIIVLKGHRTIITYRGESFLNHTGNAGLAKGGSGDALTGIIASFLAQGYEPFGAANLGVYIHGLAADKTLKNQSMESMLITDVIESLGQAFKHILK